jgi:uncharacterized integral membrane protein
VSIVLFIIFVVLLIIFIAQNNRKVPLHFLGASGTVSESIALVVAAVGGAVLLVLVGTARILQLRLATRRANRELKRQHRRASAPPPAQSSTPSAQSEPQPVKTKNEA